MKGVNNFMKFVVENLNESFNEYGDLCGDEKRPCEGAEKKLITQKFYYNSSEEFYQKEIDVWIIEINSLEDLLKIQKKYGQLKIFWARGLPDDFLRMEIGRRLDNRFRWSY